MKNSFSTTIWAGCFSTLLFLSGCEKKEEILPAVKPVETAKTAAPEDSATENAQEPELQPIQSLSAPQPEPEEKPAAVSEAVQQKEGNFVIQVGIQPSKKGAEALVSRLKEHGIDAYLARVESPGDLEGTYYRVRIGFFANTAQAQNFGKQTLEPLGFAWWVDNHANDDVSVKQVSDVTEEEAIPGKEPGASATVAKEAPMQESAPSEEVIEEEGMIPVTPQEEELVEKIDEAPASTTPQVIEDDWDTWE
ncbi:MAG: SPOR domain-containing protein [Fibrobacter sp.]|nr:SPOR domain-containing protein [Fibrobacter sp.]